MTSIGEPFALGTVTSEADAFQTFCVQPGPSETTVVVSHGQLSASLVELEGRPFKLKTWHTSHTEPFTCPVVYDGQRDKYVAASGSSLLILPQDANDTTAREKIALSNRVFAVLHQAGDQPLIVLDSGVCATLTELQDGTKSEVSHPTRRLCDDREKLIHVEAATDGASTVVVLSVATTKSDSSRRCRVFRRGKAGFERVSETSSPKSEKRPVCLFDGGLLCLSEDGSLAGRKLPLPASKKSLAAALLALDASRVLVGLEDKVLVWNVKYGTLEASRKLEQVPQRWGLVRGGACFVTGSSSNNVMCAWVKLGRATLCQAVGLGARPEDSVPAASAVAAKICFGDPKEVAEALEPVADTVPERELVLLLSRLFHGGSPPATDSAELMVLHNLLRCPHTCDVLTQCLREHLPLEQATALVVYLINFLENYSMADEKEVPLAKAMDWLACLLDAHYNHWALDTGPLAVDELLERLSVAVSRVQELFSDLCELEQWLLVLSKRVKLLKFNDRSMYSIEMMEI
ncbi:uncharacterized protein LOC144138180 [Haemaphysalis longicornis]